jgi:Bacterial tandem repeat domain 1
MSFNTANTLILTSKGSSSSTTTTQITSLIASTQITSTPSANPSSAPSSTGSVVSPPSPSSTNVATGQDVSLNDQLTTTHVSSWFYTGQTEAQVNQLCTQNNARITQIRVDNGTVPTFTVLMVQNTGVYNSSWWWYYGPNSYDQGTDRRIISVDPYYDASGTLQFAVVQVPNNGSQDRAWWWYYGQSTGSITSLLNQYNARLVSLRGYNDNGAVVYVIIMAENVDQDFIQSEWLTGITVDTINSKISSGLRLLSLSPNPSENWDAIFVAETGNKWGWYYGLNFSSIGATTSQNNMRMVDISPYMLDGQNVFATVETDNSQ